jgi:uncharacterized protein involved in tolerance to divalent cations
MKYIFNQYQGLGDILFCEPIARHFYDDGKNEIFWPINDEFMWLTDYIKYINFVPKSNNHIDYESLHLGLLSDDVYFIPLRFANPIVRKLKSHDYSDQYHTMLDKYRMLGLPENMWKTFKWERNLEKENELYNLLIKDENYILINTNWSGGNVLIESDSKFQRINMDILDGFSLFDWVKIIENASEIHTVSTSNLFLLETLTLRANKVHIYPRKPRENNFDGISEYVNKNFKLIL